jgi:hypothetical protein
VARKKFDLIIVGARYASDGRIEWVRAFERRGPTFSDHLLINREDLKMRLENGEKVVTGLRKIYEASTFDVKHEVSLTPSAAIVTGGQSGNKDIIADTPVI